MGAIVHFVSFWKISASNRIAPTVEVVFGKKDFVIA